MSEIGEIFSLNGRVAVVTGAASGIGRGIAELFAQAGARVVIADMSLEKAEAAAAELGREAMGLAVDVADETSVVALFEKIDAQIGRVDILVNNAGIYYTRPFTETTATDWEKVHAVNTLGSFLCMREAIKRMRSVGSGGAIVNISSVASLIACIFDNAHYGSSKSGVNALTKTAALEFAGDNIRVNAILPGSVETGGATVMHETAVRPVRGPFTQAGRIPLNRRGSPFDVAKAALFLASDASSYITGELICVDGGFHIS